MKRDTRIERDMIGKKRVPADACWGIHTERACENFRISGRRNHRALIRAIIEIKMAAASIYCETDRSDREIYRAIKLSCRNLLKNTQLDQFPVDVFQAGAGTSLNMNVNEVIANHANERLGNPRGIYVPVHPNDHVNRGQSTNDVMPAAMRIAAIRLAGECAGALKAMAATFKSKARDFRGIVKAGRTHLSDATPVTLSAEFRAYGLSIEKDFRAIKAAADALHVIGLGGTATGSGLNAPDAYRARITAEVARVTKLSLTQADSLYEAMQNQADFARLMGALKAAALNLIRISNDLRLLSSGPATGLNEISLPVVQAGSSIMPGKVNPSMLEMLSMVCFYVCGMEATVAMAVQAGQLELNVMMPIIADCVLTSLEYTGRAATAVAGRCISGITAHAEVAASLARKSVGIATILAPYIGYEKTAQLVMESKRLHVPVFDIIRKAGVMDEKELNRILFESIRE